VSVAQNIHESNHNVNALFDQENPIFYLSREFNQPLPTINFKCVSSKEIEDITKSPKIKNSHGCDEISTKILKLSIYYISSPLTYVCNRRLSSDIFPTRLKFSEVKSIFKKGDKNDTFNYRPFLCLHHFQRFLKRLFIIDYITILIIIKFSLMNKLVSGIASYKLTKNILTALNNILLVGGVFCDLHRHLTVSIMTFCCLK
jgi:hypothetical protein